jgi:coenzyme F420-reducing hydrogenase beta subunit
VDVCPIINKNVIKNNPTAYACINNDDAVRLESSSGGIFTLFAEKIIAEGGVVFGAAFNANFEVEHYCIENKDQLEQLRGSKYVQSRIGDSYREAKELLNSRRQVLFTGTPCQIAGLNSYLEKSYDNLVTIDIICHGVPSPEVWAKYIEFREMAAGSTTQKIAFRRKDEGWKHFSMSFLFENNTEYRKNLMQDLYMRAFLKDVCLRPSCYACEFKGLNRHSDITLADFWGIQNILPEMDDDIGTSLIFINSQSGQTLLEKIRHTMSHKEVDINKAIKFNPAATKSAKYNPNRDRFLAERETLDFNILVTKYCTDPLPTRAKRILKSVIKKVLITTRMINLAKRVAKK